LTIEDWTFHKALKGVTSVTYIEFSKAKQALEELGFFGTNVFGDYLPKWFATHFPESSIVAPTSWKAEDLKFNNENPEYRIRSRLEINLAFGPSTPRVRLPQSPTQFPESSIAERTSRQVEESDSPDEDSEHRTRSRIGTDLMVRPSTPRVKLPRSPESLKAASEGRVGRKR
jgi:hypothetical protein